MSKTSCRLCGEAFDNQPDRCPMCGGATTDDLIASVNEGALVVTSPDKRVGDVVRVDNLIQTHSTEALEAELRQRSAAIERHQAQFQRVRAELKRRRETRDEQPAPATEDQARRDNDAAGANLIQALSLKVTAMEAEQARLVVEAQQAKAAQRDAEDQLALVVKHMPKKREPMSREAARELAVRTFGADASVVVDHGDAVVDAIIEASR